MMSIKDRNQQLLELFLETHNVEQVAEKFKLAPATVCHLLSRLGAKKHIKKIRDDEILDFFTSTKDPDLNNTAGRFGVSPSLVRSVLYRNGLYPKDFKPKREATPREIKMIDLYQKGKTLQEVGDEFGVTRERVRQILAKFHVESREPGKKPKPIDEITQQKIIQLYQDGYSVERIYEALRDSIPSKNQLDKVLYDSGIQLRTAKESWRLNPRRIPDEVRQEAERLYLSGYSTVAVAKELGVAQAWVHRHMSINNLLRPSTNPHRKPRIIVSDELTGQIIELYSTGLSTGQVAKELGLVQPTVSGVLRRCGALRAKPQKRTTITSEIRSAVIKLYATGISTIKVAKELNISTAVVYKILKQHGSIRTKDKK